MHMHVIPKKIQATTECGLCEIPRSSAAAANGLLYVRNGICSLVRSVPDINHLKYALAC